MTSTHRQYARGVPSDDAPAMVSDGQAKSRIGSLATQLAIGAIDDSTWWAWWLKRV